MFACHRALWFLLTTLIAFPLHAADPYVSAGFVEFPKHVELGAVSSVAVDAQDNVYVLHRGPQPIVAFDSAGKYVKSWGAGLFKVPHGLRIDRQGNLWTTDNGNHVLRKFSTSGELLTTLGTEGKPGKGGDGFKSPDDLVFDTRGNIYVADAGNARIAKLSPEGKLLTEWGTKGKGPGQFATAHSLAIDAADRIYVGDRGNKRVQVFDSDGKHLATWTDGNDPFGLIVIGQELLASEGDIHFMVHFGPDGQVAAKWGGPEAMQLPHLMAVNSRGILYVAEVNGKRVQMFKRAE